MVHGAYASASQRVCVVVLLPAEGLITYEDRPRVATMLDVVDGEEGQQPIAIRVQRIGSHGPLGLSSARHCVAQSHSRALYALADSVRQRGSE